MMSTLDDCLEIVQQGSLAFAFGFAGMFYLSDQAKAVAQWYARSGQHSDQQNPPNQQQHEAVERQQLEERKVRRIEVRSGALVDGVTFYFTGVPNGVTYGGSGGVLHPPFDLAEGEWIAEVRGRRGASIDQIQFVTNTDRVSPPYGGNGGEPFCFRLPNNSPIGGMDCAVSINGWLRSIRAVIEVSKVDFSPPETPIYIRERGIVRAHQKRVRKRLRFVHLTVIMYTFFLIAAMSGFAVDLFRGPFPLDKEHVEERPQRAVVSLPADTEPIADSVKFTDGQETVRWVILNMKRSGVPSQNAHETEAVESADGDRLVHLQHHKKLDDNALGILVKEVVEHQGDLTKQRTPRTMRTGIVRRLDFSTHGLVFDDIIESSKFRWYWSGGIMDKDEFDSSRVPKRPNQEREVRSATGKRKGRIQSVYPRYFVDETFSPVLFYLCSLVVVSVFLYTVKTEWRQSAGTEDPVIQRFELDDQQEHRHPDEIALEIDTEILEEGTLVLPWSSSLVAVTRNWLIKTNYLGLDAIAINDARLVDLRVSGRWIMGELVEIVTLRVESRRSVTHIGHHRGRATYFFDVALPRMQFERLQASFIDRVNKRQEEIVKEKEDSFVQRYQRILLSRADDGLTFPAPHHGIDRIECLGACGEPASVIIRKRCMTCEERNTCSCEPSWCHMCLLRWWFTRNRTRIELIGNEEEIDPSWQARCPTCRVYFCLHDLLPREDIAMLLNSS